MSDVPEHARPSDSGPDNLLGSVLATVCGAGGVLVIGLLAFMPACRVLAGGPAESARLTWDPAHGAFSIGLDALSAFFLLPVVVLSTLAAVYGAGYLQAFRTRKSLAASWLFFNLFVLAMIMVLIARTALLFLLSWEVMSISAYFLVTFEHEKHEVRRAGWVYLIATHLGVAFLVATFVLMGQKAGGLEFASFDRMPALDSFWSGLIFVLALIGFGAKAGFVPFHVWLPEAHPAAPSHVSALMSGVMIKMGIYGLLRVLTFLGAPAPWWGLLLGIVGLFTALVGISLALQQRDLKRVLAYSSIENIGLIGLALGVGIWSLASSMPALAALALAAGLLHIWNHALMKGLMFLAAGSVLHATGTKDMEKLGGLMKRMPWTSGAMMAGAVAISALPPLNGFVSEWLMYLSLMTCGLETSGGRSLSALLAFGLVALVGGLAAVTFVRLTGIVLLGSPRSEAARHARESSAWMLGPMVLLVVLCLCVAVVPRAVAGLFAGALDQVMGAGSGATFLAMDQSAAPLSILGNVNAWTLVALTMVALVCRGLVRAGTQVEGPTWGCGYLLPSVRMQYTGLSFAEILGEHLLPRFLRPRTTRQPPRGLFPARASFGSASPDPVSEWLYEPFFRRWAERFSRLRILQQGKVHVYLIYMVLTVVLALAWGYHSQMTRNFMSEYLVLLGIIIVASSGFFGLLWGKTAIAGQWFAGLLAALGSGLGLLAVARFWLNGDSTPIRWPWSILGAELHVEIDGLSAIFLAPVFLISLLGNVFGLGYWKQTDHPENGRKLRLFYGTLTAGMAVLVIAKNGVLFLFGWEIMAISAFFLVATEDADKDVRDASWLYLVATHTATLCLFAVFALLHAATGSFTLTPLGRGTMPAGLTTPIFVLALVGFGLKAGIMPLHVWLPSAHAAAPSHVSAIMSAVLIKMGIYGLLRVTSLIANPPVYHGVVLLGLGAVSGVLGVAFAIGQHDLKRLLAYHSIENIGIIVMGTGLAMIGRSLGRADWVVLGLAGGLLHVWNHALFKALLFLSAGSVIHSVHTRDIDHLGGLSKVMPWTSLCFLIGSVAICGLPPLNGFVSEFLIYLGLFGTIVPGARPLYAGAAFAAPALALIGGLAVACFVKVHGAVFLGSARSEHARNAHESPLSMRAPLGVLVACCILIGTAPLLVAPILQQGVAAWDPSIGLTGPRLVDVAPLGWVSAMSLLFFALLSLGTGVLWARLRRFTLAGDATWGCGYVAPSPSMQYTSSSFAQMLVGLFDWVLRPQSRSPRDLPIFPRRAEFHSEVVDLVLDRAVLPAFRSTAWLFSWFRVLQRGNIQAYLLYIFVTLIVLLLWR